MKIAGRKSHNSASGKIEGTSANGKAAGRKRNRNDRTPETGGIAVRRDPATKENGAHAPTGQNANRYAAAKPPAQSSQTRRSGGRRNKRTPNPAPTEPRLAAIQRIRGTGRDEAIADAIGQKRNNDSRIDRTKKTHGRKPIN